MFFRPLFPAISRVGYCEAPSGHNYKDGVKAHCFVIYTGLNRLYWEAAQTLDHLCYNLIMGRKFEDAALF